jgi:DNA-directed RNA polymerase beta' subunit
MLGMEVVVREGKTIRFNLAVCKSFNADFDGKICYQQGFLKGCLPLVV